MRFPCLLCQGGFAKIDFNALPVTINQTHVTHALYGTKDGDHFIGEKALKNLPKAIQTPVAIIQSQSSGKEHRAVVILETVYNGKKVISVVEVDGQGVTNNISMDSNAMATVFAKSNALTQLKNAIDNTVNGNVELFYWNKKEALALLQKAGLQLPSPLPQDGFVRSMEDCKIIAIANQKGGTGKPAKSANLRKFALLATLFLALLR